MCDTFTRLLVGAVYRRHASFAELATHALLCGAGVSAVLAVLPILCMQAVANPWSASQGGILQCRVCCGDRTNRHTQAWQHQPTWTPWREPKPSGLQAGVWLGKHQLPVHNSHDRHDANVNVAERSCYQQC